MAKAKDFGSRPRPRTLPSRPRPRTQNLSSRTAQGQGPRPRTTTLENMLTGVAYRVCLVNENEAIKWRDLENPLPDARILAITVIQATL